MLENAADPQRRVHALLVTRVWAGVDNVWEQENAEARKMLENRAESHPSGAPRKSGGSFFTPETVQQNGESILRNDRSKSRTKQWRRAQLQSRGAPWLPVKLIYPLEARGERPR